LPKRFAKEALISKRQVFAFSLLSICLVLSGCGTMHSGKRWGEDATITPGWEKIGESAYDALTSPMFYVPLAAALLLQIDGADERLSDWATEHTPIYGSMERADDISENIRSLTQYTLYASWLATPGGDDPMGWVSAKAKGALVQQAAVGLNGQFVEQIKDVTDRKRPNGDNDHSFPSGTAANVTAFTTLTSRNVDVMNIPQQAKTTMHIGLYTLICAAAWGRVEGGCHYPSDALAGIAQGYFISSFINDSFMGLDSKMNGMPIAGFDGREVFVGYCWRF